ncbi:MAG: MotA/TolQ/ExbB proton channel family protein [Rubripirellula sp.]|nr:MotA/TolQ/ExbB proton channel family protein [Rubripirellula sp.]
MRKNNVSHRIAILSRVLPLILLGSGSIWMMEVMGQTASSQVTSPQMGNELSGTPANAPNNITSSMMGIPSLPSEETAPAENPAVDNPEQNENSLLSKIAEGGILMIPLGLCSLIVAALSIEKLISLRRSRVIPRPFVRRFTEFVEDGQLSYDEANQLCEEFNCPVAEVFQAAVRRWGHPMLEIEQAVMDAGDRVSDSLKRFVRVFHAISNVAPLIGLLGTVLGMIESFEMMSSRESLGRPEMLASGISTALVTTAGGLMVAIPAYLAFMYFSGKSDRYLNEIDRLCQRVIECISAEGIEKQSSGDSRQKQRAA